MKKLFIIFSLILYCLCCSFLLYSVNKVESTTANSNIYGRVTKNNYYLKKTPTKLNDLSNAYFLLEESYFVKILNEENDFFYIEYLDIKGYIEKTVVDLVNETPQLPFLNNVQFDIIKNTSIYSEPINSQSAIINEIAPTTNVFYYGKIYGEEIHENSGNLWYYCKIENDNNSIRGYIHSSLTNNLTPITQNQDQTTSFISKNNLNSLLSLNLTTQAIVILIISIPILFLVFLFLKGFKKY